jgi:hypothetical protein
MFAWISDDFDDFQRKADPAHAARSGTIWDSKYKPAYDRAHPQP